MRGLFVTGTDKGVGKTVLAAALAAALRADGVDVAAFKPAVTGLDEPEPDRPADHELLAAAAGRPAAEVTPHRFGPAVSPHLAAELAGTTLDPAALIAALRADGVDVAAFKPAVTGLDEPESDRPTDHELLAVAAGRPADEVAPHRFGPAVSPHLAAELAGTALDPAALVAAARALRADVVVAEGVGGLLVPLTLGYTIRDLAVDLGWPVVVAARPGLGTINHSLLTVEAARAAGLDVRAVVLTPWPERPSVMQRSNMDAIARLGGVEVATLGEVGPAVEQLARAGATLPYARWL